MSKFPTRVAALFAVATVLVVTACRHPGESSAVTSSQAPLPGRNAKGEINAAHILIMYQGSSRAPATVTRSKQEALALAQEIEKKITGGQADFAALATEFSDCPSAADGGNLGNFLPSQMAYEFSQTAVQLAVGEVSGIVETEFGYHLIRRQNIDLEK